MASNSFGTGLLQGIAQGFSQHQARSKNDELRKLQIESLKLEQKAKENALKLQDFQQGKRQELLGQFGTFEGIDQGPLPGDAKPQTLMELLAKPQGQMLALQSGMLTPSALQKFMGEAKKQDFLSSLGGDGGPSFSPASVAVAGATGDPTQLKPRRFETLTVEGAGGPEFRRFDKDAPGEGQLIAQAPRGEARIKREAFAKKSKRSLANVDKALLDAKEGGLQFITGPTGGLTLAPTALKTGPLQRLEAAGKEWIMSVLRPESGAVIGEDELDQYMATYFPGLNESAATSKLKASMRDAVTKAANESEGLTLDQLTAGGSSGIRRFEDLDD